MRQYFIKISLLSIMAFFITSCGGDSSTSSSSGSSKSELEIETKQSIFDQEKNLLNIDFLVKNNYNQKIDVSLKNLSIDVKPCNVRRISMTPKNIYFSENLKQQYVTALIEFIGECNPSSYNISSSKILTLEDKSNTLTYKSEEMEIVPDILVPNDGNEQNVTEPENYSFFNTPLPITVKNAEESYNFKVQLIDNESRGVSDKEVRILAYDVRYGEIENLVVTTDANGFANFKFTSIKDLAPINGKTLTLTIVQGEGLSTISTDVNFKFKASKVTPKNYQFQNPTSIVVKNAGESKEISIDIVNSLGIGESGKTVQITTIPSKFGSISSSSTVTNDAGRAIFKYTAPKSLDEIDGQSTTVRISFKDGDTELSQTVKITIKKSLDEVSERYQFQNPTSITVKKGNESKNISVDLVDSKGVGVSGKNIQISNIPNQFGTLDRATATTNEAGRATFIYTAPEDIGDINGKSIQANLIFTNEDGQQTSTSITITINESTDGVSENYQFRNATSITVGKENESKNISIDLINNVGIGIAGKTIQITNIPSNFGLIDSSIAITNQAGRATFNYTAPDNIDDIDGKTTTITLSFIDTDNSSTITEDITIRIKKSTDTIVVDKTLPTIVIPNELREITIKTNSKSFDIPIKVYKDIAPYASGSVSVELPEKVLNGTDVGSFSESTVLVNEQGVALFHYTGPANLKSLIDNGDTSSTFKFYHNENTAEENRQSLQINYAIADDIYIPIDYELSLTTENNDFSMGIPELQKTFSIVLKDKKGNVIKNSDINFTKVHVQTENSLIAQIYDTVNRESVNELTLKNENSTSFIIKSKKLSGIVPLKATVEFIDINKEAKTLSTIINIRVMSGPPSAISISYVGTGQDEARAKYEEKFAISVTDEYGNKVNTRPYISLGAIVGYTVDGKEASGTETNNTKRLFYGRDDISTGNANGVIDALADEVVNTTNFEDTTPARSDVFKYVNAEGANSDKLVVFGAGKNYEAMGKWDFKKIDNNTLKIQDDYFGEYRSNLYYAVGHNYYQDQCQDDGREWLGSTDSESYQLDEQGTVAISYKYDYHLTGKDALIWVNLNGYQADTKKDTRIGEVVKHTLRGRGLKQVPEGGYSLDKGTSGYAHFVIWHENAPERYRNANFAHAILAGSTCGYNLVAHSNWNDARTCENGRTIDGNYYGSHDGGSFLTYFIQAPADKGCSFNITRLLTSDEFKNINGKK